MQAAASKARAAVRFRVTAPADADWPECADGYSGNDGVTIAGVQVESMKRRMKAAHPLRDEQGVGWGDGARAGNGEEKGDHGERARLTLPTPASRYGVAHGDNLKPLNLLGHHVILGGFKRACWRPCEGTTYRVAPPASPSPASKVPGCSRIRQRQ